MTIGYGTGILSLWCGGTQVIGDLDISTYVRGESIFCYPLRAAVLLQISDSLPSII
jgi:hypothetical protein